MLVQKNLLHARGLAVKTSRSFAGLFGNHKYDPRKHQNMDRWIQNSYANVYRWGEYPDWKLTDKKRLPKDIYINPCISAVFSYLNSKYGCDITVENYDTHKNNSWAVYGIDIKAEMPTILELLASEVVVKDNKYRAKVEQRKRLESTSILFQERSFNSAEINHFFNLYGHCMWWLAQESNNWRSPSILGEYSTCEVDEILKPELCGVGDLKVDHSVNNNVFNKFLRWMHN
jgi:hypothetical protein